MWFDKHRAIKGLFAARCFGIIKCDSNTYKCWKWFSQMTIDELLLYPISCGGPYERLERKLLYYDGSTQGLKPWGITTPWKLPSITGTDKTNKDKFKKYFLKCMKQIRSKYDEKQNKAKKNKVDNGKCKNKDGDSESGDNRGINQRKRGRLSAALDDDDNKQNDNNKRRKLNHGGHKSISNRGNDGDCNDNKQQSPSPSASTTSKSRKNKEVIKPKPKERRGATANGKEYFKHYGPMKNRKSLRVNMDKYNAKKCQYHKAKHESHSIFEAKLMKESNTKHKTVCYMNHPYFFLDHPTFL